MSNLKDKNYKGISIKVVAALNAVVAIFVLTIVIVLIGFHLFRNSVMESYEREVLKRLNPDYKPDQE